MLDGEAQFDGLGVGEGMAVAAAGLDDEANRVARQDVEQAGLDQPGVHRRVEPGIIDHIVDVPVGVVVRPARGNRPPHAIGVPALQRRAAHNAAA